MRRGPSKAVLVAATTVAVFLLVALNNQQGPSPGPPAGANTAGFLSHSRGGNRARDEQRSFAFIKMFKGGSETLNGIFSRHGLENNLTFVLPTGKNIYLGWPYAFGPERHRPAVPGRYGTKDGKLDVLCHHSVFNRSAMSRVLRDDAIFISIVREPWRHFKSTFNYFDVDVVVEQAEKFPPGVDRFETYLRNFDHYDSIYQSPAVAHRRHCVPNGFSILSNLQSQVLGIPLGFPKGSVDVTGSPLEVSRHIARLDRELELVMVLERLDESLVLLRRTLRWPLQAMLYLPVGVMAYSFKTSNAPRLQDLHRPHATVDQQLYHHFATKFDRLVREQPPDFQDEVRFLSKLQAQTQAHCDPDGANTHETEHARKNGKPVALPRVFPPQPLHVPASPWSPPLVIDSTFCNGLLDQAGPQPIALLKANYPS
eukprot:m.230793 g.230793  ORF g.230793 m.230793 type:complete len:426 (+) comp18860_c1_seq4:7824-9101(+)